jgi:phosphatidylinositol glycan class A protein
MSLISSPVQPLSSSTASSSSSHSKYRICMISDFFYPNMGGVEMHIWCLSQCLIQRGHKVIVITHAYDGRQGIRYMTNGLKVYYLPLSTIIENQVIFPTLFSFFPLFRNILLRERISIIHGHQSVSLLANECILYARTMGYHVCYTDHSLFSFSDFSSIHINKLLQSVVSDIDHIICVSNACRENLVLRAKIHPMYVSTIPNAVDSTKFTPSSSPVPFPSASAIAAVSPTLKGKTGGGNSPLLPSSSSPTSPYLSSSSSLSTSSLENLPSHLYHRHSSSSHSSHLPTSVEHLPSSSSSSLPSVPAPQDTINIIVLSRLVYRKGIDLLVKIIPILCSMNPLVKFIIGGNGPKLLLLEEMKEKYQLYDRVELLGAVSHNDVRNVLIRGHIFLNCSLTESFCIAILEASSCGLFVVSTNVGGIPEVLPSDSMIKFAEPQVNPLINALMEAIVIVPTIDRYEFHERIKSMYDWIEITKRTEKIYYKILDSSSRKSSSSLLTRLSRYSTIGPFSGLAMCIVVVFLHCYWKCIEIVWPKNDIELAPDMILNQEGNSNRSGDGNTSQHHSSRRHSSSHSQRKSVK